MIFLYAAKSHIPHKSETARRRFKFACPLFIYLVYERLFP